MAAIEEVAVGIRVDISLRNEMSVKQRIKELNQIDGTCKEANSPKLGRLRASEKRDSRSAPELRRQLSTVSSKINLLAGMSLSLHMLMC
jgi:hypothetical protein